jgi:hypothetical protein
MLDTINLSIVKLDLLLDDEKPLQKKIIDDCVNMKSIILKTPLGEEQLSNLRELHKGIVFNLKKVFREERKKIASVIKKNL